MPFAFASCSDNQINLNSASLNELDQLSGIGPVYAQRIINARPFSSVDDLLNIKGIGPSTLEKIKSQGLACISSRTNLKNSASDNSSTSKLNSVSSLEDYSDISRLAEEIPIQTSTENIINLNSGEVISNNIQKEEVIFESKNEKVKRYLIFAFAFFLILIIIILLLTSENGTNYSSGDDY
jgi:competence ComEA-like helix-hairpin-helix protein